MLYKCTGHNSWYEFEIPDPPRDPKEYINHDVKKRADQVWKRPYTYTDEQFVQLNPVEQGRIMELEDWRCENGAWVLINGDPIWLPGDCYHWLTYHRIDGLPTRFVKPQVDEYTFDWMTDNDPNCFGSVKGKFRRGGISERCASTVINRSIMTRMAQFGIQSKTGDDAFEVCFLMVRRAFEQLPYWRKPQLAGVWPPTEWIYFGTPATKAKKGPQISTKAKGAYDTYIKWFNSTAKALDGKKWKIAWLDEIGKFDPKNADLLETWDVVKEALSVGYSIVGKARAFSTQGTEKDNEKVDPVAQQNFTKFWNDSDPSKRDALGRTATGLYRYFISAVESRLGFDPRTLGSKEPVPTVDKYGNPNYDLLEELWTLEEAGKEGRRAKVNFKRNYPRNPNDMLVHDGASAVWDSERLGSRLTYLQNYKGGPGLRNRKWTRGDFHWINNVFMGPVKFVESANGMVKLAYQPDIAGRDKFNRIDRTGKKPKPHKDTQFLISVDPYDYNKKVLSGSLSKGGMHCKLLNNWDNPEFSFIYPMQYLGRHNRAEMLYDDVAKAMVYFGARVNPEAASTFGIFEWFDRKGLTNFLIDEPEFTRSAGSQRREVEKGTKASEKNHESGIQLIETYFSPPVEKNEKDNLDYFWFEETLEQMITFDPKDHRRFDLVMSLIYAELGAQSNAVTRFRKHVNYCSKDFLTTLYRA